MDADEVIVATGSTAKKLPINGFENGIEAVDYLLGQNVGEKVVIIGGGLTGCEIAYDLILKGKKPVIVEMKNDLIAAKGVCLANSSFLREMLAYKKTEIYLNATTQKIEKDKVTIKDKDGNVVEIDSDDVIVSVGYNPKPIAQESKNVHLVGDCYKVGNLRTVIWRVWDICMHI